MTKSISIKAIKCKSKNSISNEKEIGCILDWQSKKYCLVDKKYLKISEVFLYYQ